MSDDSDNKFTDEFKEELWQEFLENKDFNKIDEFARNISICKVQSAIEECRFLNYKNNAEVIDNSDRITFLEKLLDSEKQKEEINEKCCKRLEKELQEAISLSPKNFNALELSNEVILENIEREDYYEINECFYGELREKIYEFLEVKEIKDEDLTEYLYEIASDKLSECTRDTVILDKIDAQKKRIADYDNIRKSMFLYTYRIEAKCLSVMDLDFFLLLDDMLSDSSYQHIDLRNIKGDNPTYAQILSTYLLLGIKNRNTSFFKIFQKT